MDPVLKKLNYKDQPEIRLLNAPANLSPLISGWGGQTNVQKKLGPGPVSFVVIFCITQKDVDAAAKAVLPKAEGDAIIWFCYPKGTSKRYKCDFNRDTGWKELGKLGWEPVRMVAIDEDWSALRFRKATHIKKMIRRSAISKAGKAKIAARKSHA